MEEVEDRKERRTGYEEEIKLNYIILNQNNLKE